MEITLRLCHLLAMVDVEAGKRHNIIKSLFRGTCVDVRSAGSILL